MSIHTSLKWSTSVAGLLLVATVILAGCGSAPTASASVSTSGASSQATPAQKSGGRAKPAIGTIDSYDTTKKSLSIKEADGSIQTFSAEKARIVKSQKVTVDQLSTLLGTSGVIVSVMGQQNSDGTYTAQTLVLSDSKMSGGAQGGGNANAAPGGVKPGGTPRAKGTPRAGGRRLVLSNAKFQNNQLVGTDQSGKAVTVALSSTTIMFQQAIGTASDLKAGEQVNIMVRGSKQSNANEAGTIIVGDDLQAPAN